MRRWLTSWKGNALLAWLATGAYAAATLWPHWFDGALPFAGLRGLGDARLGVPLVLAAFALALFLTMPAWTSRDRLLVCAGASLCLFAVVTYAVGASAALPFLFVGANILREVRQAAPRPSPLWAETQ